MANVYLYDQDCTDFTTIGLCGRLDDAECNFEEIAKGMSEITLEHPLDAMGRHRLLTPGRWIKCVVPVRNIPELDEETAEYVTTAETWRVAGTATKAQRTVYNARADQIAARKAAAEARGASSKAISRIEAKKLAVLKKGRKVTVTVNYGSQHPEWKIKCGKVSGYIDQEALIDRQTYTKPEQADADRWFDSITPSWAAREQLFRIHDVTRDGDRVIALASHEFYDAAGTLTGYDSTGNPSLTTVLKGIKANALDECDLNFYTNIKGARSGAHYRDKNIAEALLDPEDGVAARWGADVIRDGHDVYLLAESSPDRGVTLEYGVDLVGVQYKETWDNVATHVRPIGQTAAGAPLYLTENGGFLVSSHADDYPVKRMLALPVTDAVVNAKEGVTTAIARARMRAAAQEALDNGCDAPEVSLSVNFALLGNSAKYAAFRGLKQLFLFDLVRVRHRKLGIDMQARIVRVLWDCKRERMREVELGTLENLTGAISGWQITGDISGGKLSPGSVTAGILADEAINTRHLQAESVNADAIQARSITADHVALNTLKAENIKAGEIEATMLSAFNAVIQNLDAGHVTADTIDAAMAYIASLEAGFATFTQAQVTHMVANALNLDGHGTMDDVFIHNLSVLFAQIVDATIGNLCLKASDGVYYMIDVASDGTVTATAKDPQPTAQEIADGVTSGGSHIVETSITAQEMITGTLHATYLLVNKIDAARIDVDTLVARQAFINRLATREIISDDVVRIVAGQGRQAEAILNASQVFRETPTPPYSLNDLWVDGDDSTIYVCIRERAAGDTFDAADWSVSNAYDAATTALRDEVSAMIEVDSDGLHVKGKRLGNGELVSTANEVVVTPLGVDVVVSGESYSRFASNYAQFGKYQIRLTADGGLAFTLAEEEDDESEPVPEVPDEPIVAGGE